MERRKCMLINKKSLIKRTLELHDRRPCALQPIYNCGQVNKCSIMELLSRCQGKAVNTTFCAPARYTLLSNRKTEKLNFKIYKENTVQLAMKSTILEIHAQQPLAYIMPTLNAGSRHVSHGNTIIVFLIFCTNLQKIDET